MPYIETKVSLPLSMEKEEAVKAKLGKAIALLPGKSEHWLMCSFQDNCRLWFQGTNSSPSAIVEVKLFGAAGKAAYEKLTAEITGILGNELSIPTDRIYVKYEEVANWGWNGVNF